MTRRTLVGLFTTHPHLPRVPTHAELELAADAWGCNCGPAALCAATGKAPDEVRPGVALPADWPGYTNPTTMALALGALGRRYRVEYRGDINCGLANVPFDGVRLTRIQWGGPWTREGVPHAARYRKTHWICEAVDADRNPIVFDVNAASAGGWISQGEWSEDLVPWLLKQCVPRADGTWWPTHVWAVLP